MISLNESVLDRVCSYKYLGFILDDRLNFNEHISELCKIVSHKLYLLAKIHKYITKYACITIFKAMIISLMKYGDIMYAGTSARNLDDITKHFYRGLLIYCQSVDQSAKQELCHQCHISPLEVRRAVHLLLFMQKQLSNKNLSKTINVNTRLHQGPVFNSNKPNNEKAKQNSFYRGAMAWNNLTAGDRKRDFKNVMTWIKGERFI